VVDAVVQAAVGIGVIVSLIFSELLGASAGGIVVPGYIALYLDKPMQILGGFILGWASRLLVIHELTIHQLQMQSIGYIVPGLIANWFERQGFWKTVSTIAIAAVFVRLVLMVVFGGEV